MSHPDCLRVSYTLPTMQDTARKLKQNCKLIPNNITGQVKTLTWIDEKNKVGFTLPPKCASTTLRLVQMLKSGFLKNFNKESKDIWPVSEVKYTVILYIEILNYLGKTWITSA